MFTRNTARHFALAGLALACLALFAVPDAYAAGLAHHATHLAGLSPVDLVAASFGLTAAHREYGRKDAGGGDDAAGLITRELSRIGGEMKTALGSARERMEEHGQRLTDLEQRAARRGGPDGGFVAKSLGQRFVEHTGYRDLETRDREGLRIHVKVGDDPLRRKAITSAPGSGSSLIVQDNRAGSPAMLPWNLNTVRSLVAPGETASNAVFYPRQTTRTNNAAPVAEGALKPESTIGFEQVMAPVQTLAHYFLISRQSMDDAPALASIIDGEAEAGLKDKEDGQLLFGDGTGVNLFGMVPQASAFVKQWNASGAGGLDVILQAIAQVEGQNFLCDGIVLNAVDWRLLQGQKDTTGRYIGNSPFDAEVLKRIWSTPVAATNRMPRGKFLVGPFGTQAQIFDRMDVEILLSTEDSDNFRRNLVTARCEERLAFTVKRPGAFVYGDLSTSLVA